MASMNHRVVTVFGGTGFLGRRVVRHLRNGEFFVRIASRHPERAKKLFGSDDPQLQSVEANVHDERAIADALAGAYGVVNAVSLYVEQGQETFHSVHVESAPAGCSSSTPSWRRTARSRFRNRLRCCLAVALHP
ncbi:NAD(P)H-binding protein [Mesorhizobium metallidurans]|uniref:NAD(P)H-binding protein n=1 Tax=Mesorhizobium metallidurans TaxID=489722 RepID=UPI001FCC754D|nr:NAD(P)H-binding protein [Mesorhizobium metallidurans]